MGKQADPRNSCEYAFEFSSHYYDDGAFPHPFYVRDGNPFDDHGPGDTSRTVVELRMCALSASIRNKSEWWKKKDDPAIRAKWREEALSQPADLRKEWKLTPPMVRREHVRELGLRWYSPGRLCPLGTRWLCEAER